MVLFGKQQRNVATRPDASDADDLECYIHQLIAIEQHTALIGEALAVVDQTLPGTLDEAWISDMLNHRRLIHDTRLARDPPGDLGKDTFHYPLTGTVEQLLAKL